MKTTHQFRSCRSRPLTHSGRILPLTFQLALAWFFILCVPLFNGDRANAISPGKAVSTAENVTQDVTSPASRPDSAVSVKSVPGAGLQERWAKGRILVQPRAGLPASEFVEILKKHGGRTTLKLDGLGIHVVSLPEKANEKAVAELLARHPQVVFAEVDRLVPPSEVTVDDPLYPSAWHLPVIMAGQAWDYSLGEGVTVAILDSGVDAAHPDLSEQLVPGWNLYDKNSDTSDVYGHGTKVAGTVAASSNNGMGVASVAWRAKIMPVRVSLPSGSAYVSTIASGITWAADHGARIANVSYAQTSGSSTIQAAGNYMMSRGGLVFVSAGNIPQEDTTPPSDALITVSATDKYDVDAIAIFSTYGDFVDLAAPGQGIYTTVMGGTYTDVSGTSFSSPIAAAVAALVMAENPSLAPSQVRQVLFDSADDLGTAGSDMYFGHGRVNALSAVELASQKQIPDTQPPTVTIVEPADGSALTSTMVKIVVQGSDDVSLAEIQLSIDGEVVLTSASSNVSYNWNTKKLKPGVHTIDALAIDGSNNRKTDIVTVTK